MFRLDNYIRSKIASIISTKYIEVIKGIRQSTSKLVEVLKHEIPKIVSKHDEYVVKELFKKINSLEEKVGSLEKELENIRKYLELESSEKVKSCEVSYSPRINEEVQLI